jgi:glycosyltransferase involved in cell wall biosynthesis
MSKTKICYISFRKELETNLEQISRIIKTYGYQVTIINISNKTKTEKLAQDGREIISLHIPTKIHFLERIWPTFRKFIFIIKAAKVISNRKFSIIHIDSNCRYYFFLKLFSFRARLVYHIQSYPISISKARIGVYKTILGVYLQSFFLNAIIVQDEGQKLRWHGIKNLKKTRIVPIGINKNFLYPYSSALKDGKRKDMGIGNHELVLIYAGAMTIQRELDRLIFAIKKVYDTNNSLKVLFVGDGPYLPTIKRLCCKLNIKDIFIFTGFIKYENIVDFYGISDIGLSYIPINSNYTNNPPLKTYEYLACGLPCIATKTESNRRIIKNDHNGMLVRDTPEDLSNAILSLWNDKTRMDIFRINAPKSVYGFDFQTIAEKYIFPLYNEILY